VNNDGVEAESINPVDDTVVIQVSPVPQGWSVTRAEGTQRAKSLTDFKIKEDALSFAMFLAKTEPRAVVEMYDEDGLLEARCAYWVAKNVHPGMGRR
jgi:hypothetical protein